MRVNQHFVTYFELWRLASFVELKSLPISASLNSVSCGFAMGCKL